MIIQFYYIITLYTVGIPLNAVAAFGFHVGANSRAVAKIRCLNTIDADYYDYYDYYYYYYYYYEALEVELSHCSISISTASSDTIAGVRCFEPGKIQIPQHIMSMQHLMYH